MQTPLNSECIHLPKNLQNKIRTKILNKSWNNDLSFAKMKQIYESARLQSTDESSKLKAKLNQRSKGESTCETSLNCSEVKANSPTLSIKLKSDKAW